MIPTPLTVAGLMAQKDTTPIDTMERRVLDRLVYLLADIAGNDDALARAIADCERDLARASALLSSGHRVGDPQMNTRGLLEAINRRQNGYDGIKAMCYTLGWNADEVIALCPFT